MDLKKFKFGQEGTEVEKDLPFKLNPELFNGLGRGYLSGVEVVTREYPKYNEKGEEITTTDYAGMTVKNLKFTFVQDPSTVNGERRVFNHYSSLINFNDKNGSYIGDKIVSGLIGTEYGRIRHILNVMGIKLLTPMDIGYELAKERVEAWNKWIDEVKEVIDTKIEEFSQKLLWIKLTADFRTHSRYELPSFLPISAFLEVIEERNKLNPGIELAVNESITLCKTDPVEAGREGSASALPPKPVNTIDPKLAAALG